MARISAESVERVKATADMVAVVSARTQLRKAGARWTGRCPFHEERTPSFSVNAVDKLFYCFGCGKGGDLISFVEEVEGVDFAGAVEWLAERFGVELAYEEASPETERARRRRDRLLALLDQAAVFYARYLWESEAGAPVRRYLQQRNLGDEVCREFRLGLSPGGRTLVAKALAKDFTHDELVAAGLANRRGNDYFAGRLMFPLADARGRVVGFQARRLRDDDPLRAKYVNSPEGELFRKGDLLYGLHLARAAIAKDARALVVEGNTDVIALRQSGFEAVVAAMGTALTDAQLRHLGRLTRRIDLCFDGDAAGETATLRGMELAAQRGFDLRVVALPPGTDPADAPEEFARRLETAESYLHYRVRLELDRAADRQEAFLSVRELVAGVEESPERQEALRLVADRLDLPRELQAGLAPSRRAQSRSSVSPKALSAGARLERDALAGCVSHPSLLPILRELGPDHFDDDLHRRACVHLVDPGEADVALTALLAELDARAAAEA
ncbi:MAG: DNA primase, partial [Actinomycetota bacterium]|nr:DNA primase [Actinomycetota bacterium]